MVESPLHSHPNTHLYEGTFRDLVGDQITKGQDVLIAAPDGDTANNIREEIVQNPDSLCGNVEVFAGDQSQIPFQPDAFDIGIHWNPGRGVLQRHLPLYEMTAVVREGGKIVYRAPNYLAHSTAVNIDTLYALDWEGHSDPAVACTLDVTERGDPRDTEARTENKQSTTLCDF
jgi:hypothetical protein